MPVDGHSSESVDDSVARFHFPCHFLVDAVAALGFAVLLAGSVAAVVDVDFAHD